MAYGINDAAQIVGIGQGAGGNFLKTGESYTLLNYPGGGYARYIKTPARLSAMTSIVREVMAF